MLVFIDTEVDVDSQRVQDYGAVREDGAVLHTQSETEFNTFVSACSTLCGHNILNHDLKYLHLQGDYTYIDTLPLSPLLFPKKPYHKLLKDDKLQVDELNNPVNDSKKSKDLFYDELEAWKSLPEKRKEIYFRLLGGKKEFAGFFKYLSLTPPSSQVQIGTLIRE